jgi:hypothetical protein
MQTNLAQSGSFNILNKPENILAFISHALEVSTNHDARDSGAKPTHHSSESGYDTGADSDDDTTDAERYDDDDEMADTAVNLLLSVLDGANM